MDDPLRRLLIIAVLVSFTFSSSAQNAISSEENASGDITQSLGVCIPGTKRCNSPHHPNSGIHFLAEEVGTEEDTSKFEPSTICDPNIKLCKGSYTGKFDIANSLVEAFGEQDASISEPLIICDPVTELCEDPSTRRVCNPITHRCTDPKPNPIIHGEEEIISPLVCDPRKGTCQDPHRGFGIAQPGHEAA